MFNLATVKQRPNLEVTGLAPLGSKGYTDLIKEKASQESCDIFIITLAVSKYNKTGNPN